MGRWGIIRHTCYQHRDLGSGQGCANYIKVLNATIRLASSGVELVATPRHAELVVRELDMMTKRVSRTPGVKEAQRLGDKNKE